MQKSIVLEAIRKVIIETSERTAYGDYGIYNLDTRVAILEGKNLQLKLHSKQ